MTPLNRREIAFVEYMTQDETLLRKGVSILVNEEDPERYFDLVEESGLFDSANNKNPIHDEEDDTFQIPFWPMVDYLVACADRAHVLNSQNLSVKVMSIVRKVSRDAIEGGFGVDNYHTWNGFSKILGLVLPDTVTKDDIDHVRAWLSGDFATGLVCRTLDKGAISLWLAGGSQENWRKALELVKVCTELRWPQEDGSSGSSRRPVAIGGEHEVGRLINNHASVLGRRLGSEAATFFLSWIGKVYGDNVSLPSYIFRPAIEEHRQNRSWEGVMNSSVDGLRDSMQAWIQNGDDESLDFAFSLVEHELGIVRRIGIHVLNESWRAADEARMRRGLISCISADLFKQEHLHELYRFLANHFSGLGDELQEELLQTILGIQVSDEVESPELVRKLMVRRWLLALEGQGSSIADDKLREYSSDPALGEPPTNPDFLTYFESFSGPGPSPFSASEIAAMANAGTLIARLKNYQPVNSWRGSPLRAFTDALEESILITPSSFLELVGDFLDVQREFQFAFLSGFKTLWNDSGGGDKPPTSFWDNAWPKLIQYCDSLLSDEFWIEEVVGSHDMAPTKDWIPGMIAEFIRAGVQNDDRAFSSDHLPLALKVVKKLLKNADQDSKVGKDPMFQAINSPKGKAIDTLFSLSLRAARVEHKETGNHAQAWRSLRSIVEEELRMAIGANFEFSTLAGFYLSSLEYFDSEWVEDNVEKIFPKVSEDNFLCAVDGLGYSSAKPSTFLVLWKHKIFEQALGLNGLGRQAREKLVQRIALAFLWDLGKTSSDALQLLFDRGHEAELAEVVSFFWSLRGQGLTNQQVGQIRLFWQKCLDWARNHRSRPTMLLSKLSLLACFIEEIRDEDESLLQEVAPYIGEGNNAGWFAENLLRLSQQFPEKVILILKSMLSGYTPAFDYQGHWLSILKLLAEAGFRVDAREFCEQLTDLPGMDEFYRRTMG